MVYQPSGRQWTIRHGDQELTVVEVGGGLRSYRVAGVELLAGYGPDEVCREGRGQVLMPWPNRIRDGRYDFGGTSHQLSLTEPGRGHASHGLVRWSLWDVEAAGATATSRCRLFPQPGWDGRLDLSVEYRLTEGGLRVTMAAANVGARQVPFGCGMHPYVALGDTSLGDVELCVPAASEVLVDDRLIPTGTAPVRSERDFQRGRPLGQTRLDTAFTDLSRGPDGTWTVTIAGLADNEPIAVWADQAFGWVQVFTAKGEDTGVMGARGIAVEPMTCPADAFNSGEGLVTLGPGQVWMGTWGIAPGALS